MGACISRGITHSIGETGPNSETAFLGRPPSMMSPTTMTDGAGSLRADIRFSKSLPESKSAEMGISSKETRFNKACRAKGGTARNSSLADKSACLALSIASRALFLSAIRIHRIQLRISLRVQEEFAAPALTKVWRRVYPPLAEDFQNGLLVFTPVQLFVS